MRISFKSHAEDMAPLTSSQSASQLIQRLCCGSLKLGCTCPYFCVLGLDSVYEVLYGEVNSLDKLKSPAEAVRGVFSTALRKRAQGLLLARTSPSADLEPTDQDWDWADCLSQTGNLLGVPVRDYLIVAERSYYSFADFRLLASLDLFSRCKLAFVCDQELNQRLAALQQAVAGIHTSLATLTAGRL